MRQARPTGRRRRRASGGRLQKLRDAQQKLSQTQSGRGDRDIQQASATPTRWQPKRRSLVAGAGLDRSGLTPQARTDRARQIQQAKDQMDQKLGRLQDDVQKLANDLRHDERDAARKLDEASGSITDKRMRRKFSTRATR